MEYIVTFGSGQEHENYYIRIFSSKYSNVVEFMEKIHKGKYCMIYNIDSWREWEEEAKKNDLMIEKELYSINLDEEELFVLLDNTRGMYWKINNYGYTRILSNARKFTFAAAEEKANARDVYDLDILFYNHAEKLLPGYELEL